MFLPKRSICMKKMSGISIKLLSILIFLLFPMSNSEEEEVKHSLVRFMDNLSAGNSRRDQSWGWNLTSDPCKHKWKGVECDSQSTFVRKIILDELNLSGALDASVCKAKSLSVLSLNRNSISGLISEEIGNCKYLTHFYVSGNHFSGDLPDSLSQLNNLKRLDISNNNFSGELPDVSGISGLLSFFAHNNQLSGEIPNLDFNKLMQFNVSNNNLSGPIPDVKGRFFADSFLGNPELCGKPLSNTCPPAPPSTAKPKHSSSKQFLMYSGYGALGLFFVLLFAFKLIRMKKHKREEADLVVNMRAGVDASCDKPSSTSGESKNNGDKSEYSITSAENATASSSLVVLSSPMLKGLRFEDLLRAPAELLGKGKHGSLYKVMLDNGMCLAVKRIKDWGIASEELRRIMQRLDQVRHPNVLPAVAFYCSKPEKLLVYEYQPNGSLFRLLHGSPNGQVFEWGSRLNVAAIVAKALAFLHEGLRSDGIAHGNLKSTNILFDKNMDPRVSEYGLMVVENGHQSFLSQPNGFESSDRTKESQTYETFAADIYDFGVILLELLTGKMVQNNGFDLASWVHSVVREEWTVEVFDKALISEGASEERMVNLLQVALKCINPVPIERPTINQVATVVTTLKEEEERSVTISFEP